MAQDPLRVACWRFEQISPLLDERLTPSERRRMIRDMAKTPVRWPSGREETVCASTLYKWLEFYRKDPRIESLMPKPRGKPSRSGEAVSQEWLQYALAMLEEEPDRSLFILGVMIRMRFNLGRAPSRSSLHRALKKEPRYWKLRRRARGASRIRVRFQADHPHDIWHGDAKAYFWVKFADGKRRKFRTLSMLDDASRFVLRGLVVPSESTRAAVGVFRQAASRWGLPAKFYADRGSPYDSYVFRKGLAVLGVHRIATRSRNPSAHGKIEAYHRVIERWFVKELRHQLVLDENHLQELFDAVIATLYHQHVHKELKKTPREAFGDALSKRLVSLDRLREAFLEEKELVPHKRTGTVRIKGNLFRVPKERLSGRKVKVAIDPEEDGSAYLLVKPGVLKPLEPAVKRAGSAEKDRSRCANKTEPVGSLTPLLEEYRGRTLPRARAGFGLPEIYEAFSMTLGRDIPSTELEASQILDWLSRSGPFDRDVFLLALGETTRRLGERRPLAEIIKALDRPRSSMEGRGRRVQRSFRKEQRL